MEVWAPVIAFAVVFFPAMFMMWIEHKAHREEIEDLRDLSQEMEARERRDREREKRRPIV